MVLSQKDFEPHCRKLSCIAHTAQLHLKIHFTILLRDASRPRPVQTCLHTGKIDLPGHANPRALEPKVVLDALVLGANEV